MYSQAHPASLGRASRNFCRHLREPLVLVDPGGMQAQVRKAGPGQADDDESIEEGIEPEEDC
jgi:hypothetical protein